MPRLRPNYGGMQYPYYAGRHHPAARGSRSSSGLLAGPRRRLAEELGHVIRLYRLWLLVALVAFVAGYLLGTWFGHDLAAQAHLR